MRCVLGTSTLLLEPTLKKLSRYKPTVAPDYSGRTVVFVGMQAWKTARSKIVGHSGVGVILDAPELLRNYGVPQIDWELPLRSQFMLPKLPKRRVLPRDRVLLRQANSVVSTLATALYKIKDPEERDQVKAEIFNGLIASTIAKLSFKGRPEINKICASKEAINLAAALSKVDSLSVAAICKEYKISAFDIHYTLAYAKNSRNRSG